MEDINAMVRQRCLTDQDKTAFLVKRDQIWYPVTWSTVDQAVDHIAAGLLKLGLKRGETVAILGNTQLEWTLCDLGIIRAGGVSVGIYQTLTGNQSAYILRDCAACALFVENGNQLQKLKPELESLSELKWVISWDETLQDQTLIGLKELKRMGAEALETDPDFVRRHESQIDPEHVAIIVYTSGTTGPPKGARLTHRSIMAELAAIDQLFSDEMIGEIMMFFLPLSHVGERIAGQYMRISRGVAAAYLEDMNRLLADMAEIRPSFFGSVPRVFEKAYARILAEVESAPPLKQKIFRWVETVGREVSRRKQEGLPLPITLRMKYRLADRLVFRRLRELFGGHVRYFLSSSAPIAREILEFFHACGMLILEGYGQTEVSCFCTLCTPDAYRFGSVGRAMPGVELKTAEDGEIMVKGEIVFSGYLKQPEKTRETITDDGWIKTGDLGQIDEDGYLWITGRKKEIIVTSGGKNVTPTNIEFLLMKHPLIEIAMVHGDRRNYLTALISLSPENLSIWGEMNGLPGLPYQAYIHQDRLKQEIQQVIDDANRQLARYETIKKFALLPEPLQVETGELTPTMKIRRNIIEEKYRYLLDQLYSSA